MPVLSPGQLVVVDFGQMQICTASAIRELLVPMWQSLRENGCVGIVGNARSCNNLVCVGQSRWKQYRFRQSRYASTI